MSACTILNTTFNKLNINYAYWSYTHFHCEGNKKLPSSISGRVLASFWWMFAMLIITIFIANSTAHFLTKRPMTRGIPFTTFEEMSRQTDVKFGIFDKGSTMQYFKNSRKPLIRRLWTMMKNARPSVFIQDGEDYAARVLNSNGKYALIVESSTAFALARKNCDVLVTGDRINEKAHGFACKKNTDICAQFDTAILEMQRRSSIYPILRKWSPRNCSRVYIRSSRNRGLEPGISLQRFAAPLLILGVGFLLAAAVFAVEILITGKHMNQVWRYLRHFRLSAPLVVDILALIVFFVSEAGVCNHHSSYIALR